MKLQTFSSFIYLCTSFIFAQVELPSDQLFNDQTPLEIKLSYSNSEMQKDTDDSTFIKTNMEFLHEQKWNNMEVSLRARGNFRRSKCYFPPIKMKIKKKQLEGTLFEGNKTMKLVMPCKMEKENNDNVLQEFIAYKLYEIISPYHFKTRRVHIDFSEPVRSNVKKYELTGFFIEDDKMVAKRNDGKIFERYMHPLAMEDLTSVRNAYFQFLLGNTDFSVAYQHNGKLMYVNNVTLPLPYDFDMTGWVSPSYAVVNQTLGIDSVNDRKYRGFKRDVKVFDKVRSEYIANKQKMLSLVSSFEGDFENPTEFSKMNSFLISFFELIEDDKAYQKQIVEAARVK